VPKLSNRLPQARLHKPSGQARIRIDGRDIYLDKFGSVEAKECYDRLIAEWLANQRRLPVRPVQEPTHETAVKEVLAAFWRHAVVHYRNPDGSQTGEAGNFRDTLRPVRQLYGNHPAAKFGFIRDAASTLIGRIASDWDTSVGERSRAAVQLAQHRLKTLFYRSIHNR
jgi:hypothetical protein